jgi:6,7-dimethyl-8-ribityllumazine synthase
MIYIVASTFYEELSNELIKGACEVIDKNNAYSSEKLNYEIKKVPGAFEIPAGVQLIHDVQQMSATHIDRPSLIITLGVIIKGETNHFEQISDFVFNSISKLTISSKCPISFGVISAQNYEQAEERALTNRKNKGAEVAKAGLEMMKLYEKYKIK